MLKDNKIKRNLTLKVIRNGQTVQRCQTRSKRRFYNSVSRINWRDTPLKVVLRVNYGDGFFNEGEYISKRDFDLALKAFLEK
jgi:hypothetical protein